MEQKSEAQKKYEQQIAEQVEDQKPRVKFCWVCSKKLRYPHFREVVYKKDGRVKVVHKQCAGDVNAD